LFTDKTPRLKNIDELWTYASKDRYQSYSGNSASMIDHFYDKLLRLSDYPIENPYFKEECSKRVAPLIDFVIRFGRGEILTEEQIHQFIKSNMELDH